MLLANFVQRIHWINYLVLLHVDGLIVVLKENQKLTCKLATTSSDKKRSWIASISSFMIIKTSLSRIAAN